MDKFVIGNDVFGDFPAALNNADAQYGQQLVELSAQALRLEREAYAIEQSRSQTANRELKEGQEPIALLE